MNKENAIILGILAEDREVISYRKNLNNITGSVTATILLQQIIYWSKTQGWKPFFKFRAPCKHKRYKPGDSWTEELGFSGAEFDTAISKIGTKVTKGTNKVEVYKKSDATGLVIYWTDARRVTWYHLNVELLGNLIKSNYLVNQESEITRKNVNPELPITETTTETTTEIHAPEKISNGKQNLDPIEHVLSLKKDGVTESSAPNPDDQWIEYGKGFERIYQELTGRTLTYAERSELSEISSAPEADMDIWRKSVSAAILNWTGKREIPHLRRMMEVYRFGGDYDAFAAWKWAEAEPTTHLCEITKINGTWQTGDGQPYKRQKDHIFVHLADDQYWDMDGSLHKSEPGEKLVVIPLDIRVEV